MAPKTNQNSNINNNNNKNNHKNSNRAKRSKQLFTHPAIQVEKQTTPQRNANFEPMQPIDRLTGTEDRKERISSQKEPIKMTLMKLLQLHAKI